MSTVGSRIRDERIALGMSVDDLAARIGKNRATMYRYENDEIENIPVAIIGPIADALHVSPAYLMGWSEEKQPVHAQEDVSDYSRFFQSKGLSEEKAEKRAAFLSELASMSDEEFSRFVDIVRIVKGRR